VGQPVPRQDIRRNMFGQQVYVTDIRLPGMLHARMIRPPVAGTEPTAIDETSIADIPGVRIFHEKAFLAVVAEKEWNAVRAAQALGVTWSKPAAPPFIEQARLYDYLRTAPTLQRSEEVKQGDVAKAFGAAKRVMTAAYEWPYQSHASLGGACAVVDVTEEGVCIWSGTQKPHYARDGVAALLGLDRAKVRCIWTRGPGSYGRNDAGDAVMDAAYLSRAFGRPVRVQYMRDQATGWDPKGPASVHSCKAGLDASGAVIGFQFESRGFSRTDIDTNESDPRDSLAGQFLGLGQHSTQAFGTPAEVYVFPNQLLAWETVPPLLANGSPLRTAHLRDPVGPQINFASESFIDELAFEAKADPVAFRLAHLSSPRAIAVTKAAADTFGWLPRPAGRDLDKASDVVRGRGVAHAAHHGTFVTAAVEVEVNRRTGEVRTVRWAVAHDCGLVINPLGLRLTIEGNIGHSTSRALLEEVTFSREAVTSIDWESYPILDIGQVPERVDIVILDHPELPASGAGEISSRPVAAAIANAIFDATGVRIRRAPFTPDRVKAAII
jgi:nicotinate dehydrogenase subunit B